MLTLNILCCNVKGCRSHDVALALAVEESRVVEHDFDADTVLRLAALFDWQRLASVVHAVL